VESFKYVVVVFVFALVAVEVMK